MDRRELLRRYEALNDERDFSAATALYERSLAEEGEDPRLLVEYGYLLECHGRNQLRRAAELYERAVKLDPGYDKAHYQLISARAGLRELERTVTMYQQHLARSPGDVREHRFLAQAYLAVGAHEKAHRVIEAGLELVPDDSALLAARGEAKAGLGDVDGALADWRRTVDLDPEDISGLYGSAFLLEREGRLEQAAEAWRAMVEWCEARGLTLETEWPKRELQRLLATRANA
jgi:tetratricopeptide (TPR) repeat protein